MHRHRWRIETPDGRRELPGVCSCGAERLFMAGMDAFQSFHARDGKIAGLGELRDVRAERENARKVVE